MYDDFRSFNLQDGAKFVGSPDDVAFVINPQKPEFMEIIAIGS